MSKKLGLIAVILVVSLSSVRAQNNTTRYYTAFDYENVTVSNTAIGFTAAKATAANSVIFTIGCSSGTTCTIKFTTNGTTPTTSIGLQGNYADSVTIYNTDNIRAFRAIRGTSTDAVINVQFLK